MEPTQATLRADYLGSPQPSEISDGSNPSSAAPYEQAIRAQVRAGATQSRGTIAVASAQARTADAQARA